MVLEDTMNRKERRKLERDRLKSQRYVPPFKRKERKLLNEAEGKETRPKARNRVMSW